LCLQGDASRRRVFLGRRRETLVRIRAVIADVKRQLQIPRLPSPNLPPRADALGGPWYVRGPRSLGMTALVSCYLLAFSGLKIETVVHPNCVERSLLDSFE